MLGEIRLFEIETLNKRTNCEFSLPEQVKNRNPRWMGKRLKDLRLELS